MSGTVFMFIESTILCHKLGENPVISIIPDALFERCLFSNPCVLFWVESVTSIFED